MSSDPDDYAARPRERDYGGILSDLRDLAPKANALLDKLNRLVDEAAPIVADLRDIVAAFKARGITLTPGPVHIETTKP